ncbi:MAG: phosphoenolpyruvate carboxykinase (ATP) [Chlorobiota bacterium]|jgi:phosphoenolpyruvate carboxykinase (ATP)|nr:phosphoenolpyruvate carboxykinase (ATP) [Chlorobiota bacterium]QQS67434.1 MAG: phosphoenolpyruvate carboxykinase (ATP) [Chlorobiota bacterium]
MDIKKQLSDFGIDSKSVIYNGTTPVLVQEAISRNEGYLTPGGAFLAYTGQHTGRSPNDKFVVKEPNSKGNVWWGTVNKEFSQEKFNSLLSKAKEYLSGRDLIVADCYVGADPRYRVGVRVINMHAWHNLFAQTMFIPIDKAENPETNFSPEYTVVHVPDMEAIPNVDGTRSGTFIILDLGQKLILIGGTSYAGEIKKSLFTTMNYLLPLKGIMPMHCSANVGEGDDVALFFGLSGTGKTTLSADPNRGLIGDDEHGWSNDGVFNFEGGCYAKMIKLSAEAEPQIFATTTKFGTVLENVDMDIETRKLDLDSSKFTENTRGAYPLDFIDNAVPSASAGHPRNIVMLTADAFGVLPPIAKLTTPQAMYQFLSGYTAKVAGTEKGVIEPQPTFSTCFGAPFMVHHPSVYAELLGKKINDHESSCWLINTGWTGGAYGTGSRMKIKYTRAMINAALEGKLNNVDYREDPIFGLFVPNVVEGVPSEVLDPRSTWADKDAYDTQAKKLASLFRDNFAKFADGTSEDIKNAGPKG